MTNDYELGCPLHVDAKGLGKVMLMLNLESEAVMSFVPETMNFSIELEDIDDHFQVIFYVIITPSHVIINLPKPMLLA